nr:hypothetical protein Iba_chr02fCG5410 [Ipomoea batatas]
MAIMADRDASILEPRNMVPRLRETRAFSRARHVAMLQRDAAIGKSANAWAPYDEHLYSLAGRYYFCLAYNASRDKHKAVDQRLSKRVMSVRLEDVPVVVCVPVVRYDAIRAGPDNYDAVDDVSGSCGGVGRATSGGRAWDPRTLGTRDCSVVDSSKRLLRYSMSVGYKVRELCFLRSEVSAGDGAKLCATLSAVGRF